MKIAVLTLVIGDDFKKKTYYATKSKREYCKKHNYDYIDDESVYDTTRPIAWSKILLIKKYLPIYDYVLWIDADAMIVDLRHKIEDKIPLLNGKDVCVTTVSGKINTGVMLVKNTPESLKLMVLIYSQTQFINWGNWEQDSFEHICRKNIENMFRIVEIKFNEHMQLQSYLDSLQPGCFILHLAGFRGKEQAWIMKKVFERLYPLCRDDETSEHYSERMLWYSNRLKESIEGFYNKSPYCLIESSK